MYAGVPKGGVLSPFYFNIALDYILTHLWDTTKKLIEKGWIIANADDLLIVVKMENKMRIIELIKHLNKYGLKTNPDKWQYIFSSETKELNEYGKYKKSIKFLGCEISYDKSITIAKAKIIVAKSCNKIKKFIQKTNSQQKETIINSFYKSNLLYQLLPWVISTEINYQDVFKVFNSIERKF